MLKVLGRGKNARQSFLLIGWDVEGGWDAGCDSPGDDVLHVLVPQADSCLAPDGPPWDCASCRYNIGHKLNL